MGSKKRLLSMVATGLLLASSGGAVLAETTDAVDAAAAPAGDVYVSPSDYTDTTELNADDNVAAAVAFSQLAFPDGADEVVIGRADVHADAFASGLLQSGRPLLLTGAEGLDLRTVAELRRLGASHARVLGGSAALSDGVVQGLAELGVQAERLAGATRVETAVAIAKADAPDADTVILARAYPNDGEAGSAEFVDAMVAGGWSAARGWPVLLTGTGPISDATSAYLEKAGVKTVHVVGGRSAVSEAAAVQLSALGVQLARASGASRFDTATEVASRRGDSPRFVLVDGEAGGSWAAGFAAAAYSARFDAPVLPVSRAELPGGVSQFLRQQEGRRGLVCGPGVPAEVCHAAAQEAGQVRRALADLELDGDALEGEISNADGVAAITVSGCGGTFTVYPDASGRFALPLSGGECSLKVSIEHKDGTSFEQSFTVKDRGVTQNWPVPTIPGIPGGGLGLPTGANLSLDTGGDSSGGDSGSSGGDSSGGDSSGGDSSGGDSSGGDSSGGDSSGGDSGSSGGDSSGGGSSGGGSSGGDSGSSGGDSSGGGNSGGDSSGGDSGSSGGGSSGGEASPSPSPDPSPSPSPDPDPDPSPSPSPSPSPTSSPGGGGGGGGGGYGCLAAGCGFNNVNMM